MSVDYHAIGKRIRKLRLSKKWTQNTLGDNAGITKIHVSHIERGTTKLSLPAIINIANALGTSVDYLLSENVKTSTPILQADIQKVVEDCTVYELSVILDTITLVKEAVRNAPVDEAEY